MRNRRGIALLVSCALIVAPSAFAGGNDVRDTRKNQAPASTSDSRAKLGLVVGGLAGLVVGGLAAWATADGASDEQYDINGGGYALWGGCVVGGALAGYAIAGGFEDRAEQALELGRERIREAELAAAPPVEAVPELRLSGVAGFEQLAVVAPDVPALVQLAALR